MVLSIEELEAAENLDDGRNRMSSLMRLRDSTRSFIIQCLADREIQNELNFTSKAYRYNCAVIHQPHKWVQFGAINGHGWDSANNRTYDPKLRMGRVLSANNSNANIRYDETEELLQLKETIGILKEENTNIKQLYLEELHRKPSSAVNSPRRQSDAGVLQQNRLLQQEVGVLRAQLDAKTQKIRWMDAEKDELKREVVNLKNMLEMERSHNHRNSRRELTRQPTVTFDDTTRVFIPVESNNRPKQSCCIIL